MPRAGPPAGPGAQTPSARTCSIQATWTAPERCRSARRPAVSRLHECGSRLVFVAAVARRSLASTRRRRPSPRRLCRPIVRQSPAAMETQRRRLSASPPPDKSPFEWDAKDSAEYLQLRPRFPVSRPPAPRTPSPDGARERMRLSLRPRCRKRRRGRRL